MKDAQKTKKIYYFDFLKNKAENGEEIVFKSLFRENTNSKLIKECVSKAIEEKAYIEIPANADEKREAKRIQRMFDVIVNEILKERLEEDTHFMVEAVKDEMRKIIALEGDLPEDEYKALKKMGDEHLDEAWNNKKATAILIKVFEKNKNSYITDGDEGWLTTDDQDEILEIISSAPEIEDQEEGIVTVSKLVAKIDDLIGRINKTIEKLEMMVKEKGDEKEINEELKDVENNVEELRDKDRIVREKEEIDKKIEKDKEKVDGDKQIKKKQENAEIDISILAESNDEIIDDVAPPSP